MAHGRSAWYHVGWVERREGMNGLVRFGVSMEASLAERFDELIGRRGYSNRSEAIRDLVRQQLVRKEWENPDAEILIVSFTILEIIGTFFRMMEILEMLSYESVLFSCQQLCQKSNLVTKVPLEIH